MRADSCVTLFSSDVTAAKPLLAGDADLTCFNMTHETQVLAAMIQYVDEMGNTRILKNRFGRPGSVRP